MAAVSGERRDVIPPYRLDEANPRKFNKFIDVLHPHYPPNENILFSFLAPDVNTTAIEYNVVFDACCIVTGNSRNGYFTTTADEGDDHGGSARVSSLGGVLEADKEYYFQLPGFSSQSPYPIVRSFDDWQFPHHDLPAAWRLMRHEQPSMPHRTIRPSSLNEVVRHNQQTCRLTGCQEGTTVAHILPTTCTSWANQNAMRRYVSARLNPAERTLDDESNAILLRQDLHTQFDYNLFLFYPKGEESDRPAFHLWADSEEYGRLYHSTRLNPTTGSRPEFFFARFAFVVMSMVDQFFKNGKARKAVVAGVIRQLSAEECTASSHRSRSTSPKKRKCTPSASDTTSVVTRGSGIDGQEDSGVGLHEELSQPRKQQKIALRTFDHSHLSTDHDDNGGKLGPSHSIIHHTVEEEEEKEEEEEARENNEVIHWVQEVNELHQSGRNGREDWSTMEGYRADELADPT